MRVTQNTQPEKKDAQGEDGVGGGGVDDEDNLFESMVERKKTGKKKRSHFCFDRDTARERESEKVKGRQRERKRESERQLERDIEYQF